jgi:hypothetical protein
MGAKSLFGLQHDDLAAAQRQRTRYRQTHYSRADDGAFDCFRHIPEVLSPGALRQLGKLAETPQDSHRT